MNKIPEELRKRVQRVFEDFPEYRAVLFHKDQTIDELIEYWKSR